MNAFTIRPVRLTDAGQVSEIFAPYVLHTGITFEYAAPDEAEFRRRISEKIKRYPFLVAERNNVILGYAFTSVFNARCGATHTVESTVYVRENEKGQGIGRKLYEKLEEVSAAQNILNMMAGIAYPVSDDGFVTTDSLRFHERMGFRMVGKFEKAGFKQGHWIDLVWMEKLIGSHDEPPKEFIPFPDLQFNY